MSFFFKTFACIVIATEKKYKVIASLQNALRRHGYARANRPIQGEAVKVLF